MGFKSLNTIYIWLSSVINISGSASQDVCGTLGTSTSINQHLVPDKYTIWCFFSRDYLY